MKRLVTYFLLLIGNAYVCAQDFSAPDYTIEQDFQSHQIMSSGSSYGGTVYAPFENATPSEQSEVGASYSPNRGPRKSETWTPGWGDNTQGPDANQGKESPVGEPWVLLAFAAAFAAGIALRRKKQTV